MQVEYNEVLQRIPCPTHNSPSLCCKQNKTSRCNICFASWLHFNCLRQHSSWAMLYNYYLNILLSYYRLYTVGKLITILPTVNYVYCLTTSLTDSKKHTKSSKILKNGVM